MKPFSDWSVRNRLLVPPVLAILVGGLIIIQTFIQLSSSIRTGILQHVIDIGELRAAVLNLTGEYHEIIVAESDDNLVGEINDAKERAKTSLALLLTDQHDHDASVDLKFEELATHVQAFLKVGDATVLIQGQIVNLLEILEEIENREADLFDTLDVTKEKWAGSFQTSIAALGFANQINLSFLTIISEAREYVLLGEEETLEELRDTETELFKNLTDLEELLKIHTVGDTPMAALRENARTLIENVDRLVQLAQDRTENIKEIENVAKDLEVILDYLVDRETDDLDALFDNQNLTFLLTIAAVLVLVILTLTISSNRIRDILKHFDQATKKLQQGNLTVRVVAQGTDEFGQLADTFNNMAKDLQENIAFREIAENELKLMNTDLEQRVDERTAELKEARDLAEAANQLKSHLVTTMSHELRTPLTSIIGSLGLLTKKEIIEDPEAASGLLEMANRNGQQLARLVDDILDVDKLDASAVEFQTQRLDLSEVVQNAVDLNAGYAEQKGARFVVSDLVPNSEVLGDEMRLMQVLANLFSNAAKFSPDGGAVRVRMSIEGAWVYVHVTDDGPGVPDDIRSSIFDRFVRGENIDSRNEGGAGLGLNISKTLIEKQGGKIGFDSEPGEPTTFYFGMPFCD